VQAAGFVFDDSKVFSTSQVDERVGEVIDGNAVHPTFQTIVSDQTSWYNASFDHAQAEIDREVVTWCHRR
jgi:hypothetical protein